MDREQCACELYVGKERLPGKLLDESSTGYAILARFAKGAPIRRSLKIKLKGYAGWIEIEVVHFIETKPSQDDLDDLRPLLAALGDSGSNGKPAVWYRLGVRCLGNATAPDAEPAHVAVAASACPRDIQIFSSFTRIALGVGIAALFLITSLMVIGCRN